MGFERFEDIEAWQLARALTVTVYQLVRRDAIARDWALRDQMIRASSSVMHNIAEGFDGGSNAEFIRFLGYAYRSCTEVQSQLYIALDQNYMNQNEFNAVYEHAATTRGKVGALIKYLRNSGR